MLLSYWEPRQVDTAAARGINYRPLRIRMLITMRTMIFITALKGFNIGNLLSSFDLGGASRETARPSVFQARSPSASSFHTLHRCPVLLEGAV